MKMPELRYLNLGPKLTLTFFGLVGLILGGNGLLLWQFHLARVETDRLTLRSEQVIEVLRLQQTLLLFHQRVSELAISEDEARLDVEAQSLRQTLLGQIQRTREVFGRVAPGSHLDPAARPTLEALEIALPSQIEAITALASSGDWGTVRLRLANELKSLETQTASLVSSIDQEVSAELQDAVANTAARQIRIAFLVPLTAVITFFIAAFYGWSVARGMIELRLEERVNERIRITRELHDTVLQTIQGSKLVVDNALGSADDSVRLRASMEQLSKWLDQATREARAALGALRTSTVERNDLSAAFRRAVEDCQLHSAMLGNFSVVGVSKEMHPIVRDEVYRIGSEAIRNACKHSQGKHLQVRLSYARDLMLKISDDGIGIRPKILQEGTEGHFGLQGMQERAARIHGKLTISNSKDSGTDVLLVVPGNIIFTDFSRTWTEKLRSIFSASS